MFNAFGCIFCLNGHLKAILNPLGLFFCPFWPKMAFLIEKMGPNGP
jgi:hypothetical protein